MIPDSVNYIGEFAFFGCDYLEQANIPDEVTTLTEGCFGECWSLKYLELPDSIETVHEEAFSNTDLTVSYTEYCYYSADNCCNCCIKNLHIDGDALYC